MLGAQFFSDEVTRRRSSLLIGVQPTQDPDGHIYLRLYPWRLAGRVRLHGKPPHLLWRTLAELDEIRALAQKYLGFHSYPSGL